MRRPSPWFSPTRAGESTSTPDSWATAIMATDDVTGGAVDRNDPSLPGAVPSEADCREALDFLIAIEPRSPMGHDAYMAAIGQHQRRIALAIHTLRCFARATEPHMQKQLWHAYHRITNEPRYRGDRATAAIVAAALHTAWYGVGPWRHSGLAEIAGSRP